jgi:phage/plasmid-like protein (TIGR03299 family)
MTTTPSFNAVSAAYNANPDRPVMVYGRHRAAGYATEPLTAKLGTFVHDSVTPTDAFRLAGLDWTATKGPAYFPGPNGPTESPEHCSVTRSDNHALLGIHGAGYTPVQNAHLINVFDFLHEDARLESVLSIRDGRRVFASAVIDTEAEVVPGDTVRRYLHVFNSHDGSSAYGAFFSDVRLFCANQLNFLTGAAVKDAVAEGQGLRRRHTSSVLEFAHKLPELIDLERRSFATSIDELRSLTTVQVNTEVARRILSAAFSDKLARPIKDRDTKEERPRRLSDLPEIDTIAAHFHGPSGMGISSLPGAAGTAYGLLNALTQYLTHDAGRVKNDTERARARLESLWGGNASQQISRARTAALALV